MSQTLLIFALVAFIPIATPGPTVLLALTNGSRFGLLGYAAAGAQALRVLRARGVLWLDRTRGATLLALAGSLALYRRQA